MFISHIEDLINHGRYLEAQAQAAYALKTQPDTRLHQLYALALSKSGASEAALAHLEPLYRVHPNDPETAGILGSIYKELFKKNQRTAFALQSRDTYLKNFQATHNSYTGINAAAMSAIVMQAAKGKEIAQQVIATIPADTADFWKMVTLAEAYLLTKEKAKSIDYYLRAKRVAATDWGKIASVYNQLWLLNHYIPVPPDVMKVFSPPRVMAFSGHMIDHPSRKTPRFPQAIEPQVKAAITVQIQSHQAQIGFCSLACGADILFAETMLELGGEIHAWIPFEIEDFKEISVRFAGESWVDRFDKLIEKIPYTVIMQEHYGGNDDLFVLLAKVIFGAAVLEGNRFHTEPVLLSVLSETDLKRKEGGTRDALTQWPFPMNMVNVNPEAFLHPSSLPAPSTPATSATSPARSVTPVSPRRSVRYFMLLDATGMAAFERQTFEKIIAGVSVGDSVEKQTLVDGKQLLAFQFEMEMLLELKRIQEAIKKLFLWKITLHTGLIDNHVPVKESADILEEINRVSAPSEVYCSHAMAAVFALRGNQFTVTYSSVMAAATNSSSQSIYKIVAKTA